MLDFDKIKDLKIKKIIPENELDDVSNLYLYALRVKKEKPETVLNIKLLSPVTDEKINKLKVLDGLDNIKVLYRKKTFTINEFIRFNNKINEIVQPVILHDLTPFEAYLYFYNVAKSFKVYNDECDYSEATELKSILDNNYINCLGFTRVFEELLERVNIECVIVPRKTQNNDEKLRFIKLDAHVRIITHIVDNDYSINGYYISDPTWDNNVKENGTLTKNPYIYYSLICHDEEELEYDMFKLSREDFIFNVHNIEEFNEKFNIYLDRSLRENQDEIVALREMYLYSLKLLSCLDKDLFKKLTDNYFIEEVNRNKQAYYDYFTELEYELFNKVNKKVSDETIKKALLSIEVKLGIYNSEELERYSKRIDKAFKNKDIYFPYLKDINNPNKRIEKNFKNEVEDISDGIKKR